MVSFAPILSILIHTRDTTYFFFRIPNLKGVMKMHQLILNIEYRTRQTYGVIYNIGCETSTAKRQATRVAGMDNCNALPATATFPY